MSVAERSKESALNALREERRDLEGRQNCERTASLQRFLCCQRKSWLMTKFADQAGDNG